MAQAKTQHTNGSRPKQIELKKILLDGDTQSRVDLNQDVIKEYASLMKDGVEFPPLTVVTDGTKIWLVDGYHRRWAAIDAKLKQIKCFVVKGTLEDARWLSYGANRDHGLKRTNEDKAKAVEAALKHPNGAKMSDSKIAQHVGVSVATVGKYRKNLESAFQIEKVTERSGGDGKTYSTENIGRTRPSNAAPQAISGSLTDTIESPIESDKIGDCPKGGDHKFQDGACIKCYEPNPLVAPEPPKEQPVDSMFTELLEHIRQAMLLTDKVHNATSKKWGKLHETVVNSLDIAGQEVKKWKRFCK